MIDQLALLVDAVTEYAIFLLDRDGHVQTWNTGAERIKGYPAGEIIGRHFSVFYTDADRDRGHPDEELRIAVRDGRYEEEGWRVRRDGSHFWANVVITALFDADGRHLGFGKVTRDLTARREAEEGLRRVNAELDRFTSLAAHDLQEPLRTVSGFAELVLARHGDALPEDARRHLAHIDAASRRMSGLITDLLDYARLGRPTSEARPVAVAAIARQVVADLAAAIAERGATVAVEVGDDVVVHATEGDVSLLLQNLVSNGLRYGRAVRIAVEQDALGPRLTVADDGHGIAPELQTRIFEPFERGDATGGTGLGLAICRRVAARHGGVLGVQSAPGRGTVFWVRFPQD